MPIVLGLDIGGANIKACFLQSEHHNTSGPHNIIAIKSCSIPYEVWKDPQGISKTLDKLKEELQSFGFEQQYISLTMTAELCDVFSSKSEGVLCILDIVEKAFADYRIFIWTIYGKFVSPEQLREEPLQAAAANWLASSTFLASSKLLGQGTSFLVDMGSTTTDIIPIRKDEVLVKGRTDQARLAAGELVYTGVLRTPITSLADSLYIDGQKTRLANEYFAVTADVYSVLELIKEEDYDLPTPDGGSKDKTGCAKRLARAVASELEYLGMEKVERIAIYLKEKQISQIIDGIMQNISRKELSPPYEMILTGQGVFLMQEVARRLAWPCRPWWSLNQEAQVIEFASKPPLAAYSVALLATYY